MSTTDNVSNDTNEISDIFNSNSEEFTEMQHCLQSFTFEKSCDCSTLICNFDSQIPLQNCLQCIKITRIDWPTCIKCHIKIETTESQELINDMSGLPVCVDCIHNINEIFESYPSLDLE